MNKRNKGYPGPKNARSVTSHLNDNSSLFTL